MLNFEGGFLTPGQTSELLAIEPQFTSIFWGNPHQQVIGYNVIIDGASRDAGNTNFTETLRPGLLMGQVAANGKLRQWNPTAVDGTQRIAAVLLHSQYVRRAGSNADRFVGYLLFGGNVKVKGLVQAALTSAGIVGTDNEYVIRNQMSRSFRFDDDPVGYNTLEPRYMRAQATDYTVTEADRGTHFTTDGAAGAVTFTLPTVAKKDLAYWFTNTVDQNMIVVAGTPDTIITQNDIAADSVALQTASQKIGGTFKVVGTGTKWLVIPNIYTGMTVTVAT